MNMELISIIVPVYNIAQCLDRCISSLIGQKYRNMEIILVDDGSTDGSGAICNQWAERDKRIRVIHQKNLGLSAARNRGIKEAGGSWVALIDGDDYISPFFLLTMYKIAEKTQSDIVMCDFAKGSCSEYCFSKPEQIAYHIFDSETYMRGWHGRYKNIETNAWNKLYRIEIFHDSGIEYPIGRLHEDCFVTHRLMSEAKRITVIDNQLYYYYQRSNSIMHARKKRKKAVDMILAQEARSKWFLVHNYPQANVRLNVKTMMYYILFYCRYWEDKEFRIKIYKRFCQKYKKIDMNHIAMHKKLLFSFFRWFPCVLYYSYLIIERVGLDRMIIRNA